MNNKAVLMTMAALVLVTGCNRNASNHGASNSNSSNLAEATATAPSAEAAGGSPVTQASLVGTWGEDNCTNSMTFGADGTATSTSAVQGNNRWRLDGATIVITSPGQPDVRMSAAINGDNLQIGNGQDQMAVLTRCATGQGAAPDASTDSENEAAE